MKETVGKTTNPDYIFETSWEVCNKVGGIYTVLSSRAKTMQDLMADKVFFIGPDLGQGDEPTTDFHESHTLMAKWRETLAEEGLKCRIGRWNVPGQPVAILVDFTPFFAQKDEIYAKAWELFQVDSLHAYGDYDEASMFSYAAGRVAECLCRKCLPTEAAVVYQAHEWMSGLVQLQLAGTREAGSFGEKREAVYQITAPDGSTLYAGTGGFSLTEFPDAPPPLFGDNEAIVLDGDRLVLSSSFWVELGVGFFGPYLGTLTCGFQYDPAQQSFSLSPECTLQVDTPVDPSAVSLLQA